ncbi:MAG: GNAT family N-acetyltransferase [Desulfatibacillaceae bacterium]|nr:GNAT family N-acetyltransferase [Desulfatibacillaceae bacterium]
MIRKAKKEDAKQIIALIAASMPYDTAFARRYYRQYFDDPAGDKVFVWEEDGKILGVAGYCLDIFSTKYSCELGWLTVDAARRKKGIGRQLLKKVEKSAKAQKGKAPQGRNRPGGKVFWPPGCKGCPQAH